MHEAALTGDYVDALNLDLQQKKSDSRRRQYFLISEVTFAQLSVMQMRRKTLILVRMELIRQNEMLYSTDTRGWWWWWGGNAVGDLWALLFANNF